MEIIADTTQRLSTTAEILARILKECRDRRQERDGRQALAINIHQASRPSLLHRLFQIHSLLRSCACQKIISAREPSSTHVQRMVRPPKEPPEQDSVLLTSESVYRPVSATAIAIPRARGATMHRLARRGPQRDKPPQGSPRSRFRIWNREALGRDGNGVARHWLRWRRLQV